MVWNWKAEGFQVNRKGMDCCICSPMASVFRPPRNTICLSCYEGARCMIAFLNKLETERDLDKSRNPNSLQPSSNKASTRPFTLPFCVYIVLMKGIAFGVWFTDCLFESVHFRVLNTGAKKLISSHTHSLSLKGKKKKKLLFYFCYFLPLLYFHCIQWREKSPEVKIQVKILGLLGCLLLLFNPCQPYL